MWALEKAAIEQYYLRDVGKQTLCHCKKTSPKQDVERSNNVEIVLEERCVKFFDLDLQSLVRATYKN